MIKKLSRIISICLIAAMGISCMAFAQEDTQFAKGKRGTFYAYTWHQPTVTENLFQSFWIHNRPVATSASPNKSESNGSTYDNSAIQVAQKMKAFFQNRPKGGRVILPYMAGRILDTGENFYWWDEGVQQNIDTLDEVLYYYKRIGGPDIDAFILDYEVHASVWAVEQGKLRMSGKVVSEEEVEQLYSKIIADPRYKTDVRPELEAMGFEFYKGNDHNELYNMFRNRNTGKPNTEEMKNVYIGIEHATSVRHKYLNKIYDTVKKYYPNVKFSNYDDESISANPDILRPYPHNYKQFLQEPDRKDRVPSPVGTHSSPQIYANIMGSSINNPPKSYPFSTFKKTPFNSFFMEVRRIQDIVTYVDNPKFQPWVGNYTWDFSDNVPLASTDYYKEMILHIGLNNPDAFLFFNVFREEYSWGKDDEMLSKLLYELDEVAGFEDRKTLTESITPIDARYILTGMYAGGKNVWRITPDLYADGVTMENFLIDAKTPTFKVGNQFIKFPQGSYIYKSENEKTSFGSKYGYWVISPQGTRPQEYRDETLAAPSEPKYEFVVNYEMNQRKMELGLIAPQNDGSSKQNGNLLDMKKYRDMPLDMKQAKYADIDGHWAEKSLLSLIDQKIMEGDGRYIKPDDKINKVEFLALALRVLGKMPSEYKGTFLDVNKNDWYAGVVQTAVDLRFTDDIQGLFEPLKPLTREEMAIIIMRATDLKSKTEQNIQYIDMDQVSETAKKAVLSATSHTLISGFPDGSFKPKEVCTRAEVAVIFTRLLALIKNAPQN